MTRSSRARFGGPFSFNTETNGDVPAPNTRKLDAEVRDFFVARVAPALQAATGAK